MAMNKWSIRNNFEIIKETRLVYKLIMLAKSDLHTLTTRQWDWNGAELMLSMPWSVGLDLSDASLAYLDGKKQKALTRMTVDELFNTVATN